MERTVTRSIRKRIQGKGRGWVFGPKEFAALGPRTAVGKALSRLARSGFIRRVAHGVYEYPRTHPKFGMLAPNPENVANAVAAKTGSRISVSGQQAMNMLGISEQVPAQFVYLTDGPSRMVKAGGHSIRFKHVAPSRLVLAGQESNIVLQALRALGKERVNEKPIIAQLSRKLPASVKLKLGEEVGKAPGWAWHAINAIRR